MPADTLSDKGPGGGGNWVTLEAVDKNNLIKWWPTLLGTNISPPKTLFEDFFPFRKLGDMIIISYLKGISVYHIWYLESSKVEF